MIALDTNVLVRFVVRGDRRQAARARARITEEARAGQAIYIPDVVLCELVWVLKSAYGFSRNDIAGLIRKLTLTKELRFDSVDRVHRAVRRYEAGKGDLADYMIQGSADAAGCDSVTTFDRALLKEEGFSRV